jgi:DNA-binding PadR family transcriptional regulator
MAETLGEFEHLILLAILQLGGDAHAAGVREKVEREADRKVTRGALYATLDRLTAKHLVDWEVEESTSSRGGIPRRRFRVTEPGVEALRRTHAAVRTLSRGLERLLGEA